MQKDCNIKIQLELDQEGSQQAHQTALRSLSLYPGKAPAPSAGWRCPNSPAFAPPRLWNSLLFISYLNKFYLKSVLAPAPSCLSALATGGSYRFW